MGIINKLWIYGGWFYLSLFIAVFACSIFFRKKTQIFVSALLLTAFGVNLFNFLISLKKIPLALANLSLLSKQKQEQFTRGQAPFYLEIEKILPKNAVGCIFDSSDIPTRFLKQRLYPRRFRLIRKGDETKSCVYIISQFESKEINGYYLLARSGDSYLYKKE